MLFRSYITKPVSALFAMAVFDGFLQMSLEWVLLLYFNHIGFTSVSDGSFYIQMSALSYFVPVLANIPLASAASQIGIRHTLTLVYSLIASGLLIMTLFRSSKMIYSMAHAFYALFWSSRILRISGVARMVSPTNRTDAIAIHNLMMPIGVLPAPFFWLLVQLWQGQALFLGFTIDRFSILFAVNCIFNVAMASLAHFALPKVPSNRTSHQPLPSSYGSVQPHSTEAAQTSHPTLFSNLPPHAQKFVLSRLIYVCLITFAVRGSASFFQVVFPPVLINTFHASDAEVANILLIVGILAFIPPFAVTFMTKFMTDAQIMLFGLSLKILGMLLYLPVFGPVSKIQVIIGFTLVIKATLFFTTVSISVFSKVLGELYNHSYVGYVWSCAMLGPAISQGALFNEIVPLYGTWWFAMFSLPCVIAIIVLVTPKFWPWLDPNSPVNRMYKQVDTDHTTC